MASLYGYFFNDPINFLDPNGTDGDGEIASYFDMWGTINSEGALAIKAMIYG